MAKLQIIGAPLSNFVRVALIAAHEKGVDYDLLPARPHAPEVDAIHPFGRIPAMRHGDVALCESRAIVEYIDGAFPGPSLKPADALTRAKAEQWISLISTGYDQVFVRQYLLAYLFPGTPDGKPDRGRIEKVMPEVERRLKELDRAVAGGYLVGATFTLADVFLIPILQHLQNAPETGPMIAKLPALKAYCDRLAARPSVIATAPSASKAAE